MNTVYHFGLPNTDVSSLNQLPTPVKTDLLARVKSEKKIICNNIPFDKMDFTEYVRKDMIDYLSQVESTNLETIIWNPSDQVGQNGAKYNKGKYIGFVKKFIYRCQKQPLSKCGKYYTVKQKYCYAAGQDSGRIYVKNSGIQGMQCRLRGALLDGCNQDFDMINAHPTILLHIKNTYNIPGLAELPCPLFTEYVNNRAKMIHEHKFTKLEFLIMLNTDDMRPRKGPVFSALNKELKQIKAILYKEYNNKITTTNHKNPKSSITNKLMCLEENKLLQSAMQFAADNDHQVHTPMFDGCTVKLNDRVTPQQFIESLDKLSMDLGVKWSMKPHDTTIKKDPDFTVTDGDMYNEAKKNFEKEHCMILQPLAFVKEYTQSDGPIECDSFGLYTHSQFSNIVRPWKCLQENLQDKLVLLPILEKWIGDSSRREYRKMDFLPPPMVCPKTTFNTFTGFRHDALQRRGITFSDKTDISVFINHIALISGTDENLKCTEYLTHYLADMVQNPGRLPQIALIIKSVQGMGKNLFFENFCDKIFGDKYRISTSKKEQLVGRFTNIGSKMMIIADEAGSDKTAFLGNGQIKELITQPSIEVEKKGIDTCACSNFARYMFFSNMDCPIEIESSDRRFQVFEVDCEKPTAEYFDKLADAFNDDSRVLKFVDYLQGIDLSTVNLRRDRVKTSFYKELQSYSIPMSAKFMEVVLSTCEDTLEYSTADIFEQYKTYLTINNPKYTEKQCKFSKTIIKYDGVTLKRVKRDRKMVRLYTIDVQIAQKYMIDNNLVEDVVFDTLDNTVYQITSELNDLDKL